MDDTSKENVIIYGWPLEVSMLGISVLCCVKDSKDEYLINGRKETKAASD